MQPASHKWTPLPTYIELSKKHEEEKVEKKFKKKFKKNLSRTPKKKSKKILSATFQIFSKCHFLSHGEDVSGHQAVNGLPYQPTSN